MFIDKLIYFIRRGFMPAKKQITKDMILDTALYLLRSQGYEAVTIKRLAKELGCSTQPIYLSFSGMDELRQELVPLAISTFEKNMKENSNDGTIRLYDSSYINFAKSEPNLFCFLFMRTNAFSEIRNRLMPVIENSIDELMDKFNINHSEADYLHDNMWMHAHGIASMAATDFCQWDENKINKLLSDSKSAFTSRYEA